jgi:two-component system, NtrC family, response regulator AtoC
MASFDGETDRRKEHPSGALWLTVLCGGGVQSHQLPEVGVVTIGRSAECAIVIDDNSLSRRHASLWIEAGTIAIEDLGSRNGTIVGERRVSSGERVNVRVGEPVGLGDSTLIIRATAPDERPRRILSQSQLEILLESECARAADGGEPFSLARIELSNAAEDSLARLERLFARNLRPRDLLASYAPAVYEIVFLGSDRAAAQALVTELEQHATMRGLQLRCALAVFPGDGRSADELIDSAGRLLMRTAERARNDDMIVRSMKAPSETIRRVARSDINVLIFGETGVGKEVLARTLHELSLRGKRPLVSLNCAAFAENLLDSELFGHERGAFTGAAQDKPGLLESADGGTVFLDEIGEMSLALQTKLLRVIELKEVLRVGALRPRKIDVRFLAATHRDLDAEVGAGRFREDLLFRLNAMSLVVLPLRERVDEIEPLAEEFMRAAVERMKLPQQALLSDDARQALRAYAWPGNVRELRNVIERARARLGDGSVLEPALLGLEPPPSGAALPGSWAALVDDSTFHEAKDRLVEAWERSYLVHLMDRAEHNVSRAAKLAGIDRTYLHRLLKKHKVV